MVFNLVSREINYLFLAMARNHNNNYLVAKSGPLRPKQCLNVLSLYEFSCQTLCKMKKVNYVLIEEFEIN